MKILKIFLTVALCFLLFAPSINAQGSHTRRIIKILMSDDEYIIPPISGEQGFGVGTIAKTKLPAYIVPLTGTYDKTSDNYGNYMVTTDSSIMCWIPIFYYKVTNVVSAPYYGNKIEIRGYKYYGFDTVAAANDGYALHRAFIDGGEIKQGFFIDKYGWSLTNFSHGVSGIASSIKNGNPISSSVTTNRNAANNYAGSFSDCISNGQVPADIYSGAWSAAKSRGSNFAVMSIYQSSALAILSMAHQQASNGVTTYTAWNDILPYAPKGNNRSGVLNDQNDANVNWTNPTDAYWAGRNEAGQTGSASPFNKSTHNGQNSGVADLNGNQWRIVQGITSAVTSRSISNAVHVSGTVTITTSSSHGLSVNQKILIISIAGMTDLNNRIFTVASVIDPTNITVTFTTAQTYTSGGTVLYGTFYTLKESVAIKDLLGGNSTSSDHFGSTSISANYEVVGLMFADGSYLQRFGNSTNQLISNEVSRNANGYRLASLGFPMAENSISGSGTNSFGLDYYLQYYQNELCALAGAEWYYDTGAGVWAVNLSSNPTISYTSVCSRSCLYL